MIGFLYAFLSLFGYSMNQVFNKKLTQNLDANNALILTSSFLALFSFIAVLLFGEFSHAVSWKFVLGVLIGGGFGFIGIYAIFKSFQKFSVGMTMTFASNYPFVTLFVTLLVFWSFPTLLQGCVMVIVFAGLMLVVERGNGNFKLNGNFLWLLLIPIGWGMHAFSIFYLTQLNVNPFNIAFYLELAIFIINLIYVYVRGIKLDRGLRDGLNVSVAFASGALTTLGSITIAFAMFSVEPAIVSSILSTQLVIVTLLSIPLFKEKITTRQFIGIFIVLAGLILYNFV